LSNDVPVSVAQQAEGRQKNYRLPEEIPLDFAKLHCRQFSNRKMRGSTMSLKRGRRAYNGRTAPLLGRFATAEEVELSKGIFGGLERSGEKPRALKHQNCFILFTLA
jgi:hypothetical protein